MYLAIPNSFFIPVCYVDDIFNIEETIQVQEYISQSCFLNKLEAREELVIGVSLPTQRDERWVRDRKAMEAYAKEKKVTLKIEICEYDVVKQISQVKNLISQGIDILILVAVDVKTAGAMVEMVRNAGVKLVTYEALIINTDIDIFVGFNHLRAGQIQGRFLITKVPKGNYIIMYADLPYDTFLKDGAMDFITPLVIIGNIKIVAVGSIKDWSPKIASSFMENALISNNKIDAILAPNDSIAGVAIEVLQKQGLAGKVVVTGMDAELSAIRRIIKGTQAMTLFKDTRESARKTIDVAIKLGNGEKVLTDEWMYNGKNHIPSILITPVFVDKDNIDEVLIKSGYLTKEDIYGSNIQ
ncbi:sugar ABC transporter substrate-binding protein [Clostridium cellulovorans]|uniref:Monosaccharide-transporting ATPase n=1 Tax=Clostridium cellulovorans (strain ATCC 35296 / DSM 3052 / OCM 3 / 743B) TaxID=573061 RepID=D9SV40_CLOC7|nr:substrate-binding domain-containing protein [Clostridium cellulovorans]ADL53014.1 monosaccharide-transporting ATPase [Clostridium cellulovorans 743B]